MRFHQSSHKSFLFLILLFVFEQGMAQTNLTTGEIGIVHMNTGTEEFQFVTFVDLSANTEIYFTDNPANATGAIGTAEGTVLYTAPAGGVTAGTVISYTGISGGFSTTSDGNMTLANSGDNILAYQGTLSNPTTLLYVIAKNAGNVGTLPTGFTNYVYLGSDDGVYTGSRTSLSSSGYLNLINDNINWTLSGSGATPNSTSFAMAPLSPCVAPATPSAITFGTVGPNTIDASFAASATANGYLVLRTSTSTSPNVIDATVYTSANAPIGSDFESSGISTAFNSFGLTSATLYYFHVYAYTSTGCSGGPVYSAARTDSTTTLASLNNSKSNDFDFNTDLVVNSSTGISISSSSTSNPSGNSFGTSGNGAVTNDGLDTILTCAATISAVSQFEFNLASLSGTSGNGADGGDFVAVDVSTNGGSTFTTVMTVTGASNSQWLYSAVDSAVTSYSSPTSAAPSGGGNRTATDGIGKVKITGIPAGDIVVRLRLSNNAAAEYWAVDDLKLSTTSSATFAHSVEAVVNEYINNSGTTSTLTWENPDCFSNIVIIAKEGSAPTFDPASNNCSGAAGDCIASDFTASSVYAGAASNTDLPALEYCVYNGPGESVTVTGLNANTTYYYEIFTHLNPWTTKANSPDLSVISLPVDLISFSGEMVNGQVDLSWSTASEINNSHFDIYKSYDARNFEQIGRVEGSGSNNSTRDYIYTDPVIKTIQYYQLKQVDYDGQFEYSDVIAVSNSENNKYVIQHTTDNLIVVPLEPSLVTIINQNGQVVINKHVASEYIIDKADYPNGVYILHVVSSKGLQTAKWINYK